MPVRSTPQRPGTLLCLLLLMLTACGGAATPTAIPASSVDASTPTAATVATTATFTAAVTAAAPRTVAATSPRATASARISGMTPGTPATPATGATCGGGVDLLGFSDALDGARFADTDVGGLSALAYDAASGGYRGVVDNEGETPARVYTLAIPLADAGLGTPAVTGITPLRDTAGIAFTGRTSDNEGLALLPSGELLVASETEPSIRRFGPDGALRGELPVPARFLVAPRGEATNNLTFESLALAPGGARLYTATEGPLRADGFTGDLRGRLRIVRYGRTTEGDFAPDAQFFYLAEPAQGVADLAALGDTDLLVLERGFIPGRGNTVRIFRVSPTGATDVSDREGLATAGVAPLAKTLLVDLAACPPGTARAPAQQPTPLLDNFEGLALGPRLADGRQTLLLISDNNFGRDQVTRIVALAFAP
jgi:hypothetical protein